MRRFWPVYPTGVKPNISIYIAIVERAYNKLQNDLSINERGGKTFLTNANKSLSSNRYATAKNTIINRSHYCALDGAAAL